MAKRNVIVELSANVSGFVRGMKAAADETYALDESVSKLERRKETLRTLGQVGLGIGAAVAAGTAIAVKSFADFDAAMSSVQAATHETAANMDLLRDAALEAGERTVYSATEAAAGIEELSKAGVSTADILNGGLNGALDLAAAGEIAVGEAAETAASAMTQFGLAGDDVTHIADLLAAGAGKAQGGVSDLSGALNQSGLVASQMGLSIEETVGTLAEFASAGLIGSDAGTSFRSMLLRLANPTKEAAGQMEELGLNFYDAQGEFVGMEEVAAQLQERLGGLTQEERNAALANIFGQDAIRSASILYEGGAESVEKWTDAVNDAGYAQETAATRLDNLKGDWEALTGSLETLFISMGEGADGPLRALVQGLGDLVDGFNGLPDWMKQTAGAVVLGMGAIAGLGGAAVLALPKIIEFKAGLETLGVTGSGTRGKLRSLMTFLTGPWGVAMVGAAVGVQVLQKAIESVQASSEEMQNALKNASDVEAIWDTASKGRALDFFDTVSNDLDGFQDKLDTSIRLTDNFWAKISPDWNRQEMTAFSETMGAIGEELGALASSDLPSAQDAFASLAEQTNGSQRELWHLLELMPEYRDAVQAAATEQGISTQEMSESERQSTLLKIATGELEGATSGLTGETEAAAKATDVNAEAIDAMSGKAQDAETDIDSLADTIRNFGSATLDVRDASRQFEAAIDDLSASVTDNGATLDRGTEAGRANEAALDDIATSALELSAATLERTGSEEDAAAAVQKGRDELIKQLEQFGITGEKAEAYADKLGLIPDDVSTAAHLHDDKAVEDIESLAYTVNTLPDGSIEVTANTDPAYTKIEQLIFDANARAATIALNALDTSSWKANGDFVQHYANGKFRGPDVYRGGEDIVHFAEPETGWEAYISGKPSERDRNRGIWMETGERLGMLGGGGSGPVYNISQSFNLPPGFTAQQVEQISARGVQSALR